MDPVRRRLLANLGSAPRSRGHRRWLRRQRLWSAAAGGSWKLAQGRCLLGRRLNGCHAASGRVQVDGF